MKDLLTPRERFGLLVIDEEQDRTPVFPLVTGHAARVAGVSIREYYTDGRVMARCQLAAQERYGTDFISLFSEVGLVAEAMGSRYLYPEDDLPILDRPRWATLAESSTGLRPRSPLVERERKGQELLSAGDGRLRVYLDAAEYAYEARGDVVPILAYVPAPFTTAQQLVDPEAFLVGLVEDPAGVRRVLEAATQAVVEFCRMLIRAGTVLPILVDPLASGSVISAEHYREFALPAEAEVIRYLHRYDLDIVLHICGDTTALVGMMPESGADLVSVDRIGLAEAIAQAGDRVRIIGNMDTTALWLGTPAGIAAETARMVAAGRRNPKGYVAATGCEVPLATPEENVRAFVTAAKEAGRNEGFARRRERRTAHDERRGAKGDTMRN